MRGIIVRAPVGWEWCLVIGATLYMVAMGLGIIR
jgi:hypothetical protein